MTAQNAANWLTTQEFYLSLMVLAFGALVLLLFTTIYLVSGKADTSDFRRYFVVILLSIGTMLLIVCGLGDKQITPGLSFFATIVGYILGRASGEHSRTKGEKQDA